ncbi:uncharacterized protein KY384_004125 [Bacidia gigantensis]|uniref:uncharacterized protein n=1 Tax=Bacidia gigantensis TaxID=2732470 RepID=UPI001D03BC09|nr:uncharacterized protein KY384_004125 [Bacidia gigantensis]KAG8530768.1 hypothetical protein KY384_004125 [Bacidia gigantensis]
MMLASPSMSSGSHHRTQPEAQRPQNQVGRIDTDSFQWPIGGSNPLARDILRAIGDQPPDLFPRPRYIPEANVDSGSPDVVEFGPIDASTRRSESESLLTSNSQGPTQRIVREIGNVRAQLHANCLRVEQPLHAVGFNINGRLPCQAPIPELQHYESEKTEQVSKPMADQAPSTLPGTQPDTQLFIDPRRKKGSNSMLTEQDEAEVLCILLPSSGSALAAVDLIAETSPQHILQNHDVDDLPPIDEEISYDPDGFPTTDTTADSNEAETLSESRMRRDRFVRSRKSSKDIALRMSSKIHDVRLGFTFGRNPHRCDMLLSSGIANKISNCHFRIYFTEHGVPMVEDTSTNGTLVDKVLLGGKEERRAAHTSKQVLSNGTMIELPTLQHRDEEVIRFIVRFPPRGNQKDRSASNASSSDQQRGIPPPQMLPFKALTDNAETTPHASILAAATGDPNHQMGWDDSAKYNLVGQIGKGAFAIVYKVSAKETGEVYACKTLEKRRFIKDGILSHKLHNEILVMENLEHPNIVKYIEYHENKTHIYITLEYVGGGDLSIYTNNNKAMPEYMCQVMTIQIMNALDYLHKKGITHRDIKPDNILVSKDDPYVYKLSDFGLSKIVQNDETFLKSFCGTLLYCAPEIYPGFQRAKEGLHPSKRTRSGEPRRGTIPYEHNVDTWSVAAVLFHLLSGHSPYTGTIEDDGALMLMNIMSGAPCWERLDEAGISELGIDFVKRALTIDPARRAREKDLLDHPWLTSRDTSKVSELDAGSGRGSDDFGASQLSLADTRPTEDLAAEDDDIEDPRSAKRSRYAEPEAEADLFRGSNRWIEGSFGEWIANGAPDDHRSVEPQVTPGRQQPNTRLFGEIGSSALRSSGVLGTTAQDALDVPTNGSYDPQSYDEAFWQPPLEGVNDLASQNSPYNQSPNTASSANQNPLQYPQLLPSDPFAGAAPSLLGAEQLVEDLNMCSPESGTSEPTDSKPVTPSTPQFFDGSTTRARDRSSGPVTKSPATVTSQTSVAANGQQSATNRQGLSIDEGGLGVHTHNINTSNENSQPFEPEHSVSSDYGSFSDGQRVEETQSNTSLLPTAFNSQSSAEGEATAPSALATTTSLPGPAFPAETKPPQRAEISSQEAAFAKPPMRFGTLSPTVGSIPSKTIRVTSRCTTFGRDTDRDFVHPNPKEDRVPKQAIYILLWYPTIEDELATGKSDWQSHPELTAIIFTKTSRYLKINGTRLMKGNGCWLWGKLKTGDVIEVFGPTEGQDFSKAEPKQKDYLRFHCEFFVGMSKELRKADEPFKVLKEEKKFKEHEGRRSREGSAAKSREGSVAAGNSQ